MTKAIIFFAIASLSLGAIALYAINHSSNAPQARAAAQSYIERNERDINRYIANRIMSEHFALANDSPEQIQHHAKESVEWRYHSFMPAISQSSIQAETEFAIPVNSSDGAPVVTGSIKIVMQIDNDTHQVVSSRVVEPIAPPPSVKYGDSPTHPLNRFAQSPTDAAPIPR